MKKYVLKKHRTDDVPYVSTIDQHVGLLWKHTFKRHIICDKCLIHGSKQNKTKKYEGRKKYHEEVSKPQNSCQNCIYTKNRYLLLHHICSERYLGN